MAESYLPTTDDGLSDWGANADPILSGHPAIHGLTTARVAQFSTKRLAFDAALAVVKTPTTRTPVAIVAKNMAKTDLVADIREMVRIIEACPTVTDKMRAAIRITIRKKPAPIPAPADAPRIDLERVTGHSIGIRLHAAGRKTGRPAGTMGANLYGYVGPTAPAREEEWQLLSHTNRTRVDVSFDPSLAPGTTVWLTARWYNQRSETGPAAVPITSNLPGSGAGAEEARQAVDGGLRVAA